VAHEIKTPLTLIKGPVENLVEKQEIIPGIKEDLACLDRNTNRLIKLVSQILDFRQTEIRKFSLDFSRVNVSKVLHNTYLSFKILAKKRSLEYEIVLPPNDAMAFADREALEKIFSNLIGNAIKYADKRVTITLFLLQKDSDCLIIEFENDGFIIKREMEEKIFEPFYRIEETRYQKGTGIGLTLAKSLTELHKGSLYLKFIKKEVNTFVLILPIGHQLMNESETKTLPLTEAIK
jgi:signal transduction histidine kinase